LRVRADVLTVTTPASRRCQSHAAANPTAAVGPHRKNRSCSRQPPASTRPVRIFLYHHHANNTSQYQTAPSLSSQGEGDGARTRTRRSTRCRDHPSPQPAQPRDRPPRSKPVTPQPARAQNGWRSTPVGPGGRRPGLDGVVVRRPTSSSPTWPRCHAKPSGFWGRRSVQLRAGKSTVPTP